MVAAISGDDTTAAKERPFTIVMAQLAKRSIVCLVFLWLPLAAGCVAVPKARDDAAFRSADPRSILILPAVNHSTAVDAPTLILPSVTAVVAERGYYVFPANVVRTLLEDDGLADVDSANNADTARLCTVFGTDAVLYITIGEWIVTMAAFDVSVNIALDYVLRGCRGGDVLWVAHRRMEARGGNAEPLTSLLANSVLRRLPEKWVFLPKVRRMTEEAFNAPGSGLPEGPYRKAYGKEAGSQ